jgi:hypothetical protein
MARTLRGWWRSRIAGVGRGMVRPGGAWQGLVWQDSLSWWRFRKSSWQDQAMQGLVRRGRARQGLFELVALREFSRHSQARQGNATFGPEWHGTAWQGPFGVGGGSANRYGEARHGRAVHVEVRSGLARTLSSWWHANLRLWYGRTVQGFAGQGSARSGLAWFFSGAHNEIQRQTTTRATNHTSGN